MSFTGAHFHRYIFLLPHKVSTQSLYWCTCFLFGNKKHFYQPSVFTGACVHRYNFLFFHLKYQPCVFTGAHVHGTISYFHIKYQPCILTGAHVHRYNFLLPHDVSILSLYWCTCLWVQFLIST